MTTRERKRLRRECRKAAESLVKGGTFLNVKAPPGSIPYVVAQWYLKKARK